MSTPAAVLAPLLLAGVFLLSAAAKASQLDSTLSAIILLRLPRAIQRRWVARALPVGEAVLALALLAPWTVVAAAGISASCRARLCAICSWSPRPRSR